MSHYIPVSLNADSDQNDSDYDYNKDLEEDDTSSSESRDDVGPILLHGYENFHRTTHHRPQLTKLYLEPVIRGMNQLYQLYSEGERPLSRWTITNLFHDMNLSIHPVKKDKYDICVQYEVGHLYKQWQVQVNQKSRARLEKNNDKAKAKQKECQILTIYLQVMENSSDIHPSDLARLPTDPMVAHLCDLRYLLTGVIEYKLEFDDRWSPLQQRSKIITKKACCPPMYQEQRKIKNSSKATGTYPRDLLVTLSIYGDNTVITATYAPTDDCPRLTKDEYTNIIDEIPQEEEIILTENLEDQVVG
ncbi:hypothetical protein ILUMI_18935 [Ignelater luminosus]|uniref:Uncharacterized protein n=1 Tax=Ignelater luminosus TaxID=2038154 RepID=A0A8K0CMM7_IGNLU|nr:hypothetical protein ILUMI_18935 [Ignelater luminosus]